ncbi:MAG: carboxypeptidase regulatory-like domain-containing protein [Terriglobales bacterium]
MNHLSRCASALAFCALLAAALLWSAAPLNGQEFRATLSGIVKDPSGAAVPRAQVTAVKKDSGQTYAATSNRQGFYSIPYLIPGVYQVTVAAPGFAKSIRTDVPLSVAQKQELDFTLRVGGTQQELTVSAAPPVVQTGDASGGTTMDLAQVQNLPLNGRQVYMLLALTPGTQFLQTQFGSSGYSGTRGWDANNNYSMGGGWTGLNQFLLNGSPVITDEADGWSGGWYMSPNEDAIQEFKIMTNTYDAEYGRTGGGVVNTTLKAGTNQFHGTIFDYYVNSVFNANTYTSNLAGGKKGLDITNQYGGTFGGPIKENKAFFFGSFEGYHQIIPFPVITSTLPSAVKVLPDGSVDFSATGFQIFDPLTTHACTAADLCAKGQSYARNPFPNDIIPGPNTALPPGIQSRVSATGLAVLKLWPAPTSSGLFNNYIQNGGLAEGRYRYYQPMVRVDYNFTEATRMYTLFAWQKGHEHRNHQGFPYPIAEGELDSERDFVSGIVDLTHAFSPASLIDLQGSFGRFHQDFPAGPMVDGLAKPITAQQLGLAMPKIPTTTQSIAPEFRVSGYPNILGNSISEELTNNFDFRPVFTRIVNRHDLRFGGEMEDIQYANMGVGQPLGNFQFGSGFTQDDPFHQGHCPACGTTFNTDGYSFASLALGDPDGGNVDWNQTQFETWHYYGMFVQDDFRATPRLTLNLGLRWDVQTSPSERFNRINAGFCWTCVNPVTNNSTYQANIADPNNVAAWQAAGVTVPSQLMGGLLFAGVNGAPRAPYHNYLDQWQPRIGVAFALRPTTVLRGGFGLFYAIQNQHDTTTGFNQGTSYIDSLDGGLTPADSFPAGTPYPNGAQPGLGSSQGLLTNVGNGIGYDWRTRRIPKSEQWSFGIQHELPSRVLLDVSYDGNYTRNMTMGVQWDVMSDAQQAACEASPSTTCRQLVPNPFYGVLPLNSSLGSSSKIQAYHLYRGPFPEFDGVYEYTNPGARSRWDALEVKVQKRATRGLTMLASFTYERQFEDNHWLNNGTFRDQTPIYEPAYFDRPLVFNFSGVWQLPFGQGRHFLPAASGWEGGVVSGWDMDWELNDESGVPTGLPDLYYVCSGQSMAVTKSTYGQWFNNDPACWQRRPDWSRRTMPDRVSWIRNPYAPQLNMALQKRFHISERWGLQFRGEAFNLTNTPIFPGPDTNISHPLLTPDKNGGSWSGFGTVPFSQQNFPRQVQFSLKLLF